MKGLHDRLKDYFELTGVSEIARRYFVMNAFDGVLTMLGVIIGAYMAGNVDRSIILGSGISVCIAMGLSGFSGAYMTEQAERTREMKKLESALLIDLNGTHHDRANRFAVIFVSMIDGLSPAVGAIIVVAPFFFGSMITHEVAVYASIILALLTLFLLGAYLAHISDERLILHGTKMLVIGIITIITCTVVISLI